MEQGLAPAEGESAQVCQRASTFARPSWECHSLPGPNALCSIHAESLRQPHEAAGMEQGKHFKGASFCATDHRYNLATEFYGSLCISEKISGHSKKLFLSGEQNGFKSILPQTSLWCGYH